MSILREFKEFAVKGNAIDMAIGIIIGAAFGKIISSLVDDIIMPPIGMLVGGVDFTNLAVTLKEATLDTPAVTVNYGNFIQTLVNFTIIAFAVFMIVKLINRFRRKQETAPEPAPTKEALLLAEIRDLLRERK
ncbi:large-conductance mechanosensitive channel protein MscL [Methylobacter sp. Wu1]|uniref:large-conductance mechanosensitive channel protein MscL n=1 Tax=Methylobacter sp. Wu1 TaxID=3119359 RepID=UPI002F95C82B